MGVHFWKESMETCTVDLKDAPQRLHELIRMAEKGTEVVLADGDTPLARLVAVVRPGARIPGLHSGTAWTSDDFDEPLPDEIWSGTE
jgi:antitoxin (DNA-binding transcriptional repressor) of toxin-antitoxin stability system